MSMLRVLAAFALMAAILGGLGTWVLTKSFLYGAIAFVVLAIGAGVLHNAGDRKKNESDFRNVR